MTLLAEEKLPSVINDPFKKNSVTKIEVEYGQKLFDESKWVAIGWVHFKNGNTTGRHKVDGENFDDVVLKIKAILGTLE